MTKSAQGVAGNNRNLLFHSNRDEMFKVKVSTALLPSKYPQDKTSPTLMSQPLMVASEPWQCLAQASVFIWLDVLCLFSQENTRDGVQNTPNNKDDFPSISLINIATKKHLCIKITSQSPKWICIGGKTVTSAHCTNNTL